MVSSRGQSLKDVFRKENFKDLLIYGLGQLGIQGAFFLSIDYANAATAAILVLTGPLFVVGFLAIGEHRKVRIAEIFAIVMSSIGVICLVTKGDLSGINFSVAGVFWGLVSAMCGAFCTVQLRKLLKRMSVMQVVGWGMFFDALVACIIKPPFTFDIHWDQMMLASYGYIVLIGTVSAFWCYLKSLKFVAPSVTSILACFEPLSAVVLSVILLGTVFTVVEAIGAALIFSTVFVLARSK